jgi:hypothetical protein
MVRDVAAVPASSNFFASVTSSISVETVASLYRSAGWAVRKCGLTEFEASSAIGELVIEGNPVLVHGAVADPVANADAATQPLRDGAVGFVFECYGPDTSLLL